MAPRHPLVQPVEPAPHRGETRLGLLFFCLLAGPIAWSLNNLVDYGLASHACYPRSLPRETVLPGWEWLWSGLLIMHLGGILLAAVAAVLAFRVWRRTKEEGAAGTGGLLEAGEGRTRFMASWGVLSGLASIVAIAFSGIALVVLPPCANLLPP